MGDLTLADLSVGDRVEMAAHTDAWMRGDRYATIEKIGTRLVTVAFERSGSKSRLHPVVFERKAPVVQTREEEHEEQDANVNDFDEAYDPLRYEPKPGDTCYYEGDNVVHDSFCGTYEPGTLTNRTTGRVVGKKEI